MIYMSDAMEQTYMNETYGSPLQIIRAYLIEYTILFCWKNRTSHG